MQVLSLVVFKEFIVFLFFNSYHNYFEKKTNKNLEKKNKIELQSGSLINELFTCVMNF